VLQDIALRGLSLEDAARQPIDDPTILTVAKRFAIMGKA
jgi:hypothetical protein